MLICIHMLEHRRAQTHERHPQARPASHALLARRDPTRGPLRKNTSTVQEQRRLAHNGAWRHRSRRSGAGTAPKLLPARTPDLDHIHSCLERLDRRLYVAHSSMLLAFCSCGNSGLARTLRTHRSCPPRVERPASRHRVSPDATMGKSLGTKFSGKGPGLQKKTKLQRKYLTDPKAKVRKGNMAELDFGALRGVCMGARLAGDSRRALTVEGCRGGASAKTVHGAGDDRPQGFRSSSSHTSAHAPPKCAHTQHGV